MSETLCRIFRPCHKKNTKKNIIIPLLLSYYIPQNPQYKISQIVLKNYNQFRSVITEALRWLKITTYTGMKPKFETTVKERYQTMIGLNYH